MQISGLMTGFDTADLVQRLMQVERAAGDKLVKAKTSANALSGAYTSLNGLMLSLKSAADAVKPDPAATSTIWDSVSATSSNNAVATATASPSAQIGNLTFKVTALATAGSALGAKQWTSATDTLGLAAGETLSFRVVQGAGLPDEKTIDVSVPVVGPDATIGDVAKAINDKHAGVNATVVKIDDGSFRLQLMSSKTGEASNITVQDAVGGPTPAVLGSFAALSLGTDAELTVGDTANAYTLKSGKNTFVDILPGVNVTVAKVDPSPVTVKVTTDTDAMAGKVDALVSAANAALANIRINSKYDTESKTAQIFLGDSTARTLSSQVTNLFVGSTASAPGLVGVSIDRYGSVTFDKSKFTEAYAKDPAKVQATINKLAEDVSTLSNATTNSTSGTLTAAIRGQDALQQEYTAQIKRFDERMTAKEGLLTRQYNTLDSMLSKLKMQGDWLAGQLKSLPTMSSNSK
ncbi:MAG: flagellar filament capping protein FliD [Austwickia sp.]|nr:flagellar filament capping protein FliD [Austwickia sp.]